MEFECSLSNVIRAHAWADLNLVTTGIILRYSRRCALSIMVMYTQTLVYTHTLANLEGHNAYSMFSFPRDSQDL